MVYKTPAGWVVQCPCGVTPCPSWAAALSVARFKALTHRSPGLAILAAVTGARL